MYINLLQTIEITTVPYTCQDYKLSGCNVC